MTILESDIKLLESQRMADTTDGGGRMTSNEIPDGEPGNIFPKVSRTDAVYGRVNLRKVYAAVKTATLDTYAGAHCIITDPPDNEKIGCLLFSTGSSFDTRSAARDRIESYVVAGPLARMRLYGDQVQGQRAVTVYQRPDAPLPDVGEVIVLSVEADGYTPTQQFVRITDVTHQVSEFVELVANTPYRFEMRVIVLKIGSALKQQFNGAEVTQFTKDAAPTKVRLTQVADASKYYGITPLAEAAEVGALALRLPSVYAPLVPSTQRETAVSQAEISGTSPMINIRDGTLTEAVSYVSTNGVAHSWFMRRHIKPGTFIGIYPTWSGYNFHDDANGNLISTYSGEVVGTVAYEAGVVTFIPWWTGAGSGYATYQPAVTVQHPSHTRNVPITLSTRGTVYAEVLNPLPAPGSVIVDFSALGRWYRFRDNGAGEMVANDPSEGSGSIDYVTGSLVVTLGAMPDVDSAILIAWGTPAHYTIRAGATSNADTSLVHEYFLPDVPIVPGSVTIGYLVGGVERQATDSAGAISGTGVSGTINYVTGEVRLRFTAPPDRNTTMTTDYTWRDGEGLIATGSSVAVENNQFTVPGTPPFRNAGTMSLTVTTELGAIEATSYVAAGGTVRISAGEAMAPSHPWTKLFWVDQQIGLFNSATGVVTLTANPSINRQVWSTLNWHSEPVQAATTGAYNLSVEQESTEYDPAIAQELHQVATLTLGITTSVGDPLIPWSLLFTLCGKQYVDRNGTLYIDINSETGAGTEAGQINYSTGLATLTYWADNTALGLAVNGCLTQYGEWTATDVSLRTAGSPIRPASFYIQATTATGTLISGAADQNGVITGAYMSGEINQDMGVVTVEFGSYDGPDWTPIEVMPATIRYNCVVLSNLPLDAEILGLDPVRLPADGRVPIYRPADVVVIHHTDSDTLANPLQPDTVYNLSRDDLARAWVEDATGQTIPAEQYTLDLGAGTLTTSPTLDLIGYTQPLVVRHRIEDMALLSDVQINGQITLSAPTLHDYPLGSYVSGALLYGDLWARVSNVFDQATWSGAWSDERIGSDATATYNDLDYPPEVLNNGAVTERWRVNFTGTTAFQLIGENLGVIATGNTSTDLAPVNALTGEPYFVLRAAGWGSGWAAGNQLRFNTHGANAPTWIARTILAGASLAGDSFDLEVRGDTD